MKKFLVIGNPIDHSLSPKLHNYWFQKNNIKAIYEKMNLTEDKIEQIITDIKLGKIEGANITVPFKKKVIPFLDQLTPLSQSSQSVNTIYKEGKKTIGHNTDIGGFELAIHKTEYEIKNKKAFILGAGGVAPSIILALKKMGVSKILLSNRTKKKCQELKNFFPDLEIIEWGETPNFDIIINATSLGLRSEDKIELDYSSIGSGKLFYDVIYNPKETGFLKTAQEYGNKIENGKMMFIYQAHQAFTIWNKIMPEIDEETIRLLD